MLALSMQKQQAPVPQSLIPQNITEKIIEERKGINVILRHFFLVTFGMPEEPIWQKFLFRIFPLITTIA